MGTFVKEIEEELTQKLIPFWENLRDEEYGGFYGYMGYDLKVQKDYEKGCILNEHHLCFCQCLYDTWRRKTERGCRSCICISEGEMSGQRIWWHVLVSHL